MFEPGCLRTTTAVTLIGCIELTTEEISYGKRPAVSIEQKTLRKTLGAFIYAYCKVTEKSPSRFQVKIRLIGTMSAIGLELSPRH